MKMTKMDLTNFKKDSLEMGFTDRQERHPGHRYQHMKRCKSNFQIDSDFFFNNVELICKLRTFYSRSHPCIYGMLGNREVRV